MNFKEKTYDFIQKNNIENGIEKFKILEKYVAEIERKNIFMNLTGFQNDTLWQDGIFESIVCLFEIYKIKKITKLLDIGAGVGFPSIPFKIIFPEIELLIVESQLKRTIFLNELFEILNLKNIKIINDRIENLNNLKNYVVTARAVAPLSKLLFLTSKIEDSNFAFIKGPNIFEEIESSKKIIEKRKIKFELFDLKKNNSNLLKNIFIFYFSNTY